MGARAPMLFHDPAFLFVFLPATLLAYYAAPRAWRNALLLLASCLFYAASSLTYAPLLFVSTVLDFLIARKIAAAPTPRARKAWLVVSLGANLSLLGFFKYAGLITTTLRSLGADVPVVDIPLPIGISFFIFQTMSYTIDVYRREVPPARNLIDFATFVVLYPQLIAGPIVRYSELDQQLTHRTHDEVKFASGVRLFVLGMAKKILLADTAAWLAAPLLDVQHPSCAQAWASTFLFSAQIYYDFSGYSDMATGLGRMVGFEFPQNFNSPYKATSFSDFWRRWHMTLSRWLRDYLYVPLGGNRLGPTRTYVNLAVTMLLGGLWHGASWNFVLWGAWHGLLLSVERFVAARWPAVDPPRALRRAVVFLAVSVGWVFFFRDTLPESVTWLRAMFLLDGVSGGVALAPVAGAAALLLGAFVLPNTWEWRPRFDAWTGLLIAALFVVTVLAGLGAPTAPFLYYRF